MGPEGTQDQQKDNQEPAGVERTAGPAAAAAAATAASGRSYYPPQHGPRLAGACAPDDIPLTRDNLMLLQRAVGNRAVVQLLKRKGKLSQPGDAYEGDADSRAARASRMPEPSPSQPFLFSSTQTNAAQQDGEPMQRAQQTQAKEGPATGGGAQSEPEKGASSFSSTDKLPPNVEADMEASFGADFSGVRIHQDSQADSLGALAYTQGSDIHLAPGQYAPHTQGGKELLGHELAHVLQQSEGHVRTTAFAGGVPLNDDPALEREADDLGARAARGERVGRVVAASSSGGDLAKLKEDTAEGEEPADSVENSGEESVSLAEDAETPVDATEPPVATAQPKAAGRPIQARAAHGPIQRQEKKEKTYVPYQIHVKQPMTQQEFREAAMRQIFGRVMNNLEWVNSEGSYTPENSPVTLWVDTRLLRRQRSQANRDRGISVGAEGGVIGAEERARTFHAGPESGEKSALLTEINRRYFVAVGDKTETKIKPGEKGKAELWRMIRDEVLFQHEYITNLPPQVKELIRFSTKGKTLTMADYDKLFALAKKIEKLPAGQVSDYASKVTATAPDLDALEASLNKYIAEMAVRGQQREERDKIQTKLIGLEEVYRKYRLYRSLLTSEAMAAGAAAAAAQSGVGGVSVNIGPMASTRLYNELETELPRYNFAGVAEFEAFIRKFEQAFEQESANIAKDLLAKYAGKLYQESERYKNPAEVAALHQKLGGLRTQFREVEEYNTNAKIWNDYVQASEQARIPGQGHLRPKISLSEAEAARQKAEAGREKAAAAKGNAEAEMKGLSSAHPVFQEEGLPLDRRIDKVALAKANESELGALLQGYIQNRLKAIGEARAEIEGKPELIYKMDKLMPQFYIQQGIRPGSIHDMIIQDKMRDDAILKLVKGIAFAIVAIALSVITFGAATPVIIAAGTGLAGATLGVYLAVEEYQEYTQQKNLADVGFSDDPSMVWVILAVVGAGLDMAAAFKAVKALAPAAKALNAGGDLAEFNKAVRALEKANEIEAKVARAAERAAAARKGLAEATGELTKVMGGKMYSFPGPLADPDVYKAVVKMARQAIKTMVFDAQKFIEELKLARIRAGLGDLTPEELAKAKQAWEEAKTLEAAEAAIEAAEQARVGTYTTKIKWGIQTVEARPHTSIKGAFWGRRTPQANPRVNAFELKINPNNESFFLPHPSGGYVQFEQLAGGVVQDGKLIMQPRSLYHVADMEQATKSTFASQKVLAEARRQMAAASDAGLSVEWLVSDARALQQLDALFQKEGITITLRLLPE